VAKTPATWVCNPTNAKCRNFRSSQTLQGRRFLRHINERLSGYRA
jgi:hypothetical protein